MEEKLIREKAEADLLRKHGFIFETVSTSFLKRWFPLRSWQIRPLCFGTIIEANKYAVDIKMNLGDEDISTLLKEMNFNIEPLINFISVSILHSKFKILLFRKILSLYLKWHLKPEDAFKITLAILQMYDLGNFIHSIRTIGQTTLTSPKPETPLIDTNKKVSTASSAQSDML